MSEIGVSTIGNRKLKSREYHHCLEKSSSGDQDDDNNNNKSKNKASNYETFHINDDDNNNNNTFNDAAFTRQEKVIQTILKRLESDSRFFETNQPYALPNFTHSEIELRKEEVGKGEFGVVYEVSAIHVADECPCPKCKSKREEQEREQNLNQKQKHNQKKQQHQNQNQQQQQQQQQQVVVEAGASSRIPDGDRQNNIVQVVVVQDEMDPQTPVSTQQHQHQSEPRSPLPSSLLQSPHSRQPTTEHSGAGNPLNLNSQNHNHNDYINNDNGNDNVVVVNQHNTATTTADRHRRLTSHISFAEDVKIPDDDSTLSTESDPEDFFSMHDDDTDGEAVFLRGYMSTHVLREGRPRYAVKRLLLPSSSSGQKNQGDDDADDHNKKNNNNNNNNKFSSSQRDHIFEAAADLAAEAKFLASIRHPNIVKMRGTVGRPGSPNFMIVMDCLVMTLRDKISQWDEEWQQSRMNQGLFRRLRLSLPLAFPKMGNHHHNNNNSKDNSGGGGSGSSNHQNPNNNNIDAIMQDQHADKLLAVYDIARAMRYLHNHFIIFRDLKPENVAFDVRGDMRLFDFGLAKELKQRDLVQPPDGFCATGLTGSRRYMAPEVVQCKNYGLSADVYSYSIVFWEVFTCQMAFPHYTLDQHFEQVVLKGKRPNSSNLKKRLGPRRKLLSLLSKQLETMMVNMWDANPLERPNFKSICEQLGAECVLMNANSSRSAQSQLSDRTSYLMNRSLKSQKAGAAAEVAAAAATQGGMNG